MWSLPQRLHTYFALIPSLGGHYRSKEKPAKRTVDCCCAHIHHRAHPGDKISSFRGRSPRVGNPAPRLQLRTGDGAVPAARICSASPAAPRAPAGSGSAVLHAEPEIPGEVLAQRKAMLNDPLSVEAGSHPKLLSFQRCNVILHRLVLNYFVTARFQFGDVQFSSVTCTRNFRIICDEKLRIFCYCSVHAHWDIFTLSKWILYSRITEGFHC